MKLDSMDWLTIQFALENEAKRMKEFEDSIHEFFVTVSAKEQRERMEVVLRKMEEMGLHYDHCKEKERGTNEKN